MKLSLSFYSSYVARKSRRRIEQPIMIITEHENGLCVRTRSSMKFVRFVRIDF